MPNSTPPQDEHPASAQDQGANPARSRGLGPRDGAARLAEARGYVVSGAVRGASADAPTQAQTANGRGDADSSQQAVDGNAASEAQQQQGQGDGQDQQPQIQIEVPEKPKLADDITLKGEMQESAFVEAPWLLERDGGFIQVPKLLYHVAEQCTGDQTHEQMAEAMSQKLGRKVTAENIKTLVAKLIPMGIVDVPNLPEELRQSAPSGPGALSVNAKMLRVPPRVFAPLSKVLQFFYIKPILVLTVLLTFAAEGWLFLVHGVGGGIHDALYTPGLMIAVFAMIIIATAFHEFGHASALQYGGGKVGEMGAGIYIVYPAFYTDVTDNYRLSRWARVRTDLGGIYFSLIFSFILMALYVATDAAFLLMVVIFINFEIFHNLLPFVRLDGYWTLADVTGIPDFFSMLVPYCRTHAPFKWLPWKEGRMCPELKPWAKWVFGLYIVITVPLLVFLLFIMVTSVPRILATFWDAMWQQVGNIGNSWQSGDYLGLAASVGQILLLALPTFALVFTLFNLSKKLVVGIWNWGKKSPKNAVIASAGSALGVLLLVFLWSPGLILSLFIRGVPDKGPLQNLVQFKPIGQQERFALGDVISGQVVTVTRKSGLAMFGLDFDSASTVTSTITATATLTTSNALTSTRTALAGTPSPGGSATVPVSGTITATLTSVAGTLTGTTTVTVTPIASTSPFTGTVTPGGTVGVTGTASVPVNAQGTALPTQTAQATGAGTGTATAAPATTQGATTPTQTLSGSQPTTAAGAATPTSQPTVPGTTPTTGTGSTPVAPTPTSATQPTANPVATATTAPPPPPPAAPTSTPVVIPTSTPVPADTPAPADTPVPQPTPPPGSTPLPTFTSIATSTTTPTATATATSTPTAVVIAPTTAPEVPTATATPIAETATTIPATPTETTAPASEPSAPTATPSP